MLHVVDVSNEKMTRGKGVSASVTGQGYFNQSERLVTAVSSREIVAEKNIHISENWESVPWPTREGIRQVSDLDTFQGGVIYTRTGRIPIPR